MSALTASLLDWAAERAPPLGRALHLVERARALLVFHDCEVGEHIAVRGPLVVDVRGAARIGSWCCFAGGPVPTALRVGLDGALDIADRCYFNYGVTLEVTKAVRIGRRCMFGSYVRVSDATPDGPRPVVLGDDVWVAHGAVILPGVTVGDRAVVAAGSVVTQDVPAGMLALGNPARVMSQQLTQGAP